MNTARTEPASELAKPETPLLGIDPGDALAKAREACTRLVRKYPASTVLGAFAVGFALARLFRRMTDD